jgi:Endonuclease NucS
MTRLYKLTESGAPARIPQGQLPRESMIQEWVAKDPQLLGLDLLIIGKEVPTPHGGRIDLLAIDDKGDLLVLELKRDRTPRDIIAQVLDYASWVAKLSTREVHDIARTYWNRPLEATFENKFQAALPETLNKSHTMLIVASAFDESSHRIVRYLSEHHDIAINTAFFSVFDDGGVLFLTTDWLLDQEEVTQRSEAKDGPRMTVDLLLEMAANRQVTKLVGACRDLGQQADEEPAASYGGSFRYWFRGKMIVGVNVSGGRRRSPPGELDIWTAPSKLAELVSVPEKQIRDELKNGFQATDAGTSECVVRLNSEEAAQRLVALFRSWLNSVDR